MLFESMSRGLVPGSGGVFAACLTPISGSLRNEKMGKKGIEGSLEAYSHDPLLQPSPSSSHSPLPTQTTEGSSKLGTCTRVNQAAC